MSKLYVNHLGELCEFTNDGECFYNALGDNHSNQIGITFIYRLKYVSPNKNW
jgi:hypothetical protein